MEEGGGGFSLSHGDRYPLYPACVGEKKRSLTVERSGFMFCKKYLHVVAPAVCRSMQGELPLVHATRNPYMRGRVQVCKPNEMTDEAYVIAAYTWPPVLRLMNVRAEVKTSLAKVAISSRENCGGTVAAPAQAVARRTAHSQDRGIRHEISPPTRLRYY